MAGVRLADGTAVGAPVVVLMAVPHAVLCILPADYIGGTSPLMWLAPAYFFFLAAFFFFLAGRLPLNGERLMKSSAISLNVAQRIPE